MWPKIFPKNKVTVAKPGTTKDGNPTATGGGATGGDEHVMPRGPTVLLNTNNRLSTVKKKPANHNG